MTIEESEQNLNFDTISAWLGEPLSSIPTILGDPYDASDFTGDSWFLPSEEGLEQELMNDIYASFNHITNPPTPTPSPNQSISITPNNQEPSDSSSRKRKVPDETNTKPAHQATKKTQNLGIPQNYDAGRPAGDSGLAPRRNKKSNRQAGNNGNIGNTKDGRWAEQLLNPCAMAITSRNQSRVQHFFYVLQDLADLSSDANHRLAAHGLHALAHHLSSSGVAAAHGGNKTFSSSNPKFFRDSLIKFNDISPWFRIPNNIANTSILQILAEQNQNHQTVLHILDIGVSHGVQWPTLLEELTRRQGGPPPLVRLTVVNDKSRNPPFATGPSNYDFSSQLLVFAKDLKINLEINRLEISQQKLNSQTIGSSTEETLIVCAQFRLHNLSHNYPDSRTEFLRILRSLEPKGVILSENDMDCTCNNCGDFAVGFSKRLEYLWRFLDSTSVAYKGRSCDERTMMEAEAAKVLINVGEMNERKEKWCERMVSAGFRGEAFGEETIDGAKLLLRKYDSNWEVRVDERDGHVGLWWKGQPVSFCSLWKTDFETTDVISNYA